MIQKGKKVLNLNRSKIIENNAGFLYVIVSTKIDNMYNYDVANNGKNWKASDKMKETFCTQFEYADYPLKEYKERIAEHAMSIAISAKFKETWICQLICINELDTPYENYDVCQHFECRNY